MTSLFQKFNEPSKNEEEKRQIIQNLSKKSVNERVSFATEFCKSLLSPFQQDPSIEKLFNHFLSYINDFSPQDLSDLIGLVFRGIFKEGDFEGQPFILNIIPKSVSLLENFALEKQNKHKFIQISCVEGKKNKKLTLSIFRNYIFSFLIKQKWPQNLSISMISMIREMELNEEETTTLLKSLSSKLKESEPQNLPSFIHKLLLIKNNREKTMKIVVKFLNNIQYYFTQTNTKKLWEICAKSIEHINLAARQSPALGKMIINKFKKFSPKNFSAFNITLLFALTYIQRFSTELNGILHKIVNDACDSEIYMASESWFKKIHHEINKREKNNENIPQNENNGNIPPKINDTFKMIIKNNAEHKWYHVHPKMLNFATQLIDKFAVVKGKNTTTITATTKWGLTTPGHVMITRNFTTKQKEMIDLAKLIIKEIFSCDESAQRTVLSLIFARIISKTPNSYFYISILHDLVLQNPQAFQQEHHQKTLIHGIDYINLEPSDLLLMVIALNSLLSDSPELFDRMLLALRQMQISSDVDSRVIAVVGLAKLTSVKIPQKLPQIYEAVFWSLRQQGPVKLQFYHQIQEILDHQILLLRSQKEDQNENSQSQYKSQSQPSGEPTLALVSILDTLAAQLSAHFQPAELVSKRDKQMGRIKIDNCIDNSSPPRIVEPIPVLLLCLSNCLNAIRSVVPDSKSREKTIHNYKIIRSNFEKMGIQLAQTNSEEFEFHRDTSFVLTSPLGKINYLIAIMLLGSYEVYISHFATRYRNSNAKKQKYLQLICQLIEKYDALKILVSVPTKRPKMQSQKKRKKKTNEDEDQENVQPIIDLDANTKQRKSHSLENNFYDAISLFDPRVVSFSTVEIAIYLLELLNDKRPEDFLLIGGVYQVYHYAISVMLRRIPLIEVDLQVMPHIWSLYHNPQEERQKIFSLYQTASRLLIQNYGRRKIPKYISDIDEEMLTENTQTNTNSIKQDSHNSAPQDADEKTQKKKKPAYPNENLGTMTLSALEKILSQIITFNFNIDNAPSILLNNMFLESSQSHKSSEPSMQKHLQKFLDWIKGLIEEKSAKEIEIFCQIANHVAKVTHEIKDCASWISNFLRNVSISKVNLSKTLLSLSLNIILLSDHLDLLFFIEEIASDLEREFKTARTKMDQEDEPSFFPHFINSKTHPHLANELVKFLNFDILPEIELGIDQDIHTAIIYTDKNISLLVDSLKHVANVITKLLRSFVPIFPTVIKFFQILQKVAFVLEKSPETSPPPNKFQQIFHKESGWYNVLKKNVEVFIDFCYNSKAKNLGIDKISSVSLQIEKFESQLILLSKRFGIKILKRLKLSSYHQVNFEDVPSVNSNSTNSERKSQKKSQKTKEESNKKSHKKSHNKSNKSNKSKEKSNKESNEKSNEKSNKSKEESHKKSNKESNKSKEELKEESNEKSNKKSNKESKEKSKEKSKEESNKKPKEESKEESNKESNKKSHKKSNKKSNKESNKKPNKKPKEESHKKPKEELKEESNKKSNKESNEKSNKKAKEESHKKSHKKARHKKSHSKKD